MGWYQRRVHGTLPLDFEQDSPPSLTYLFSTVSLSTTITTDTTYQLSQKYSKSCEEKLLKITKKTNHGPLPRD